jgi:predicted dehydrogenase
VNEQQVELFNETGESIDTTPITSLQKNAPGQGFTDVEGELACFYEVVRNQKKLGVTTEEAFHHLAFIVAALESVKSQAVVKVQQV